MPPYRIADDPKLRATLNRLSDQLRSTPEPDPPTERTAVQSTPNHHDADPWTTVLVDRRAEP